MAIGKRNNRNTRERISTSLDADTKRALDAAAEERGRDRSDVVEEAVRGWLAARYEEDAERVTRLQRIEEQLDKQEKRLAGMASNAEIAAFISYEALRYQFPQTVGKHDPDELRRQAVNRQRNR